jgi:hypothetical protein
LRCVLKIADDALDRILHAEEPGHAGIDLDRAVEEDASKPRILACVDDLRFADRLNHTLGGAGVHCGVVAAAFQIFREAHRHAPFSRIGRGEQTKHVAAFAFASRACA